MTGISYSEYEELFNDNFSLWEEKSEPMVLTYTFLTSLPDYYGDSAFQLDIDDYFIEGEYAALTSKQQGAVKHILEPLVGEHYRVSFSDVIRVSFLEVSHTGSEMGDSGDITLGRAGTPLPDGSPYGVQYDVENATDYSTGIQDKSGIVIDKDNTDLTTDLDKGDIGYITLLHELSHSLGLDDLSNTDLYNTAFDNQKYSIMSRNKGVDNLVYAKGLQLLDIAALQEKWGTRDYATRQDDTEYSYQNGLGAEVQDQADPTAYIYDGNDEPFLYTIWDGEGVDEIDAIAFDVAAQIDLRQGRFSSIGENGVDGKIDFDADDPSDPDPGNVAIAYHTIVENATGTLDASVGDSLIGNAWNNVLYGAAGGDTLYGDGVVYDGDAGYHTANTLPSIDGIVYPWGPDGIAPDDNDSGNDILIGGTGDDVFYAGAGADIIHGGYTDNDIQTAYDAVNSTSGGDWDPADQFELGPSDNLSYQSDGKNDGRDTVNFSKLDPTYSVTITLEGDGAYQAAIYDGSSTLLYTQYLYSIEDFIGTSGTGDVILQKEGQSDGEFKRLLEEIHFEGFDVVGLNSNDNNVTLDLSNVTNSGNGVIVDGNGGNDNVIILSQQDYAESRVLNQGGTETVTFQDVEDVDHIGTVLPNASASGDLSGNTLDYSAQTAGLTVEFTGSGGLGLNSGRFIDTWEYRGYSDTKIRPGTGAVQELHTSTYVESLYASSVMAAGLSGPQIIGSNAGDTIIVTGEGDTNLPHRLGYHLGYGDDNVFIDSNLDTDVAEEMAAATFLTYYGGDDNVYNAEGILTVSFWEAYRAEDVSMETVGDDIVITVATESMGRVGTITLHDATTQPSLNFYSSDEIYGNWGADHWAGRDDRDETFYGQGGDDTLNGMGGKNEIYAGEGDDTIVAAVLDADVDIYDGGAGDDNVVIGRNYEDVSLTELDGRITVTELTSGEFGSFTTRGVETLTFSDGVYENGTFTAFSGSLPVALADDTFIVASTGGNPVTLDVLANDVLVGGVDIDYVTQPSNADSSISFGADNLTLTYTPDAGATGEENLIYNILYDGVLLTGSITIINVDAGAVQNGSTGNDYLDGTSGTDALNALEGHDVLVADGGIDLLQGGDGHDTYVLDSNADSVEIIDSAGMDRVFIDGFGLDSSNILANSSYDSATNVLTINDPGASVTHVVRITGFDSDDAVVLADSGTWSTIRFDAFVNDTIASGDQIDITEGNDTVTGLTQATALALGAGSDTFTGSTEADFAEGESGNDVLNGGDGNDLLYGGSLSEVHFGTSDGADTLNGGAGNDTLVGGTNDDSLSGGAGDDTYVIHDGDGDDTVTETGGTADQIVFGAGLTLSDLSFAVTGGGDDLEISYGTDSLTLTDQFSDSDAVVEAFSLSDGSVYSLGISYGYGGIVAGTAAGETLNGTSGHDLVLGFDGNDTINGGAGGNDTLLGHTGDDVFILGTGGEFIDGGDGFDTVNYSSVGTGLSYDLANGTVSGAINDTITGIERVISGAGNDYFFGSDGDETYVGSAGNDTISGGDGFDTVDYSAQSVDITVDIYSGDVTGTGLGTDSLSAIEAVVTGSGDDDVTGWAGDDTFVTGDGDDTLTGGSGNDVLQGGAGDDVYHYDVGDGRDVLTDTGGTDDTIVMAAGITANDVSFTQLGDDLYIQVFGSTFDTFSVTGFFAAGGDNIIETMEFDSGPSFDMVSLTLAPPVEGDGNNNTLDGTLEDEDIFGYGGDDVINGSRGDDTIDGGSGTDTIDYTTDSAAVTVDLAVGTASSLDFDADTLSNIENVTTGSGDDTVTGDSAANILDTGAGDDSLTGNGGADTLKGGSGDDIYYYDAGDGADVIDDIFGADKIVFGSNVTPANVTYTQSSADLVIDIDGQGVDTITIQNFFSLNSQTVVELVEFDDSSTFDLTSLTAGSDIYGTSGGEVLYGTTDDETIGGLAGNDTIRADSGHDFLIGGAGNDTLYGEDGDDTYHYESGWGTDTISENVGEGLDTISFGSGISASDLRLWVDGGEDLNIELTSTGDSIEILGSGSVTDVWQRVERIQFADGSEIDLTQGLDLVGLDTGQAIYGTDFDDIIDGRAGNDTLRGNEGDDILIGGAGTDYLYGYDGDDTYHFESGWDSATISENVGEGLDTISFGSGISASDLRLWVDGGEDLNIELASTGDSIEVLGSGSVTDVWQRVERIQFADGSEIDLTNGLDLVGLDTGQAIYGTDFDDTIDGRAGNDTLRGYEGDDILIGGAGTDYLYGYEGNDTYHFESGWGTDTISENLSEGLDVISFGSGITASDLRLWVDGYEDLHIELASTGDSIKVLGEGTVGGTITDVWQRIERIQFDDGSYIDQTLGLQLVGRDTGQVMYGSDLDDLIIGRDGNDTLRGYAGDDILVPDDGDDNLYGGAGNDVYEINEDAGYTNGTNVIYEDLDGGIDTLRITGSVSANDIGIIVDTWGDMHVYLLEEVLPNTYPLMATIVGSGYSGQPSDVGDRVESITFGDGTGISLSQGLPLTGFDDAETLSGSDNDDIIDGNGGNDTINAYGGDDLLYGGAGADTLNGGLGNDTLSGDGGDDTLDGGGGTDTADYSTAVSAVTVDLSVATAQNTGGAGTDTLSNIENLTGSDYDDTLSGNSGNNVIDGGVGSDTADYSDDTTDLTIDLVAGTASSTGSGSDTLQSIENIVAGSGDDTITGDSNANDLDGSLGSDIVDGGSGDDTIWGNSGADTLYGADGLDTLNGGDGDDTFVFEADFAFNDVDVIEDFDITTEDDVIDISDVLSGYFDPMTDAITDFVQITDDGTDSSLYVDTSGSGSFGAGTQIALIEGITGLTDEAALAASGNLLAA